VQKNEYNKDTETNTGIKVHGNKYLGEPRRREFSKVKKDFKNGAKSCKKVKKKTVGR
jgi:hypothetical protein